MRRMRPQGPRTLSQDPQKFLMRSDTGDGLHGADGADARVRRPLGVYIGGYYLARAPEPVA